uniref:Collagen alpha-1(XXVII) chain n=1 Tax=Talaromyces marneffei PM1 TaxID=1077442 RepID=A0A093VS29_TALMA
MADSEFEESGRTELIRDIAEILYRDEELKQPLAVWAFMWFSDLSCLRKIKEHLTEVGRLDVLGHLTYDVILPWLYKDTAQVKSAPATPVKSVASTPTGRKSRESTIAPAGNNPKKRRMEAFDDTSAVESSSPAAFASSIPSNPPTPPVDQTIPKKWRDSGLRKMIENWAVLENAHIYPNSLGPTGYKLELWDRLRLFWSEEKVNKWESLLGTLQGTESLLNTITMNTMVHKAWGQALFALKHVKTNATEDKVDLEFYWLKPYKNGGLQLKKEDFTKPPTLPSNKHLTSQQIKSGDIITMKCYYPTASPLPSKALIKLQWYLNRIASLTAAATDFELKLLSDDDDDDDGFDYRAILASSQTTSTKIFSSQPNIDHSSSMTRDSSSDDESDDKDDRNVQPAGTTMDVTEIEPSTDSFDC